MSGQIFLYFGEGYAQKLRQSFVRFGEQKDVEREFRLGKTKKLKDDGTWEFDSDVGKDKFEIAKTILDRVKTPLYQESRVLNKEVNGKKIRKIIDYDSGGTEIKILYQIKTSLDKLDKVFIGNNMIESGIIRFSSSRETSATDNDIKQYENSKGEEFQRLRQRYSYLFDAYKIELTIVGHHTYEIELEFSDTSIFSSNITIDLVAQNVIAPLKALMKIVYPQVTRFYSIDKVGAKYQNLVQLSKGGRSIYESRPKNISESDIDSLREGYSTTNKLNGVSYRLCIVSLDDIDSNDKKSGIFLINSRDLKSLLIVNNKVDGTLVDLEYYIQNERIGLHIYDVLLIMNKNYTTYSHDERIKSIEPLVGMLSNLLSQKTITIEIKRFFNSGDIVEDIDACIKYMYQRYGRTLEEDNDGLIFTPTGQISDTDRNKAYYDSRFRVLKWKFPGTVTIDFKTQLLNKSQTEHTFSLLTFNRNTLVPFGPYKHPYKENITVEPPVTLIIASDNKYFMTVDSGTIVEVTYNKQKHAFEIYKIRYDKTYPNGLIVAQETFIDMIEEFTLERLIRLLKGTISPQLPPEEKKEVALKLSATCLENYRKYHNAIKGYLIQKYASKKTVLDLGIGNGGDLGKYERNKIKYLWGVEPDNDHFKELTKIRLPKFKHFTNDNSTFIYTTAENTALISKEMLNSATDDISSQANVINAFFSLTFFFQSQKKLDDLLNTVNKNLLKNGYFIATFMDGNKIRQQLLANNGIITDQQCFTIKNMGNLDLSLSENPYGREITINLKKSATVHGDQIEWLVDFDTLKDKMTELNYDLVDTKFFDNIPGSVSTYKDLTIEEKLLNSFYRYVIFKKKPPPLREEDIIRKKQRENSLPSLDTGKKELLYLLDPSVYPHKLVRVGTIGDGSCFFYSLLTSVFGTIFTSKTPREMTKMVTKVREVLSFSLTQEKYENLSGGNIAKLDIDAQLENVFIENLYINVEEKKKIPKISKDVIREKIAKAAEELTLDLTLQLLITEFSNYYSSKSITMLFNNARIKALNIYKKKLLDCSNWVNFANYEYIASSIKYNIFMILDPSKKPVNYQSCDKYISSQRSVAILNLENKHYESIYTLVKSGNKITYATSFLWDDPLVTAIYGELCKMPISNN